MSKQQKVMGSDGDAIFRLPPFYYMHVLDLNSNVTRIEVGPKTFIRQDNERVVLQPERMITIPPRHYCVVENPVVRNEAKQILMDSAGQYRLAHADLEIRLSQEPFPLYPGETLKSHSTPLKVVRADSALRLKAILDFEMEDGGKRVAGDEWLFEGPGTYIPRKEVTVEETVGATIIGPNQALKLRARRETLDREGKMRVTGEEWMVNKTGAYLPGAFEEVVEVVNAYVLTEKKALHVVATRTFKDQLGVVRKNGEEWLVRMDQAETYIPDVYEDIADEIEITTLSNRQYCVVLNPVDNSGKPQYGKRKLVKGEKSFFLQPGESLEKGIQNIYVLSEMEGLILRANEAFHDDGQGVDRQPGDRWMIRGPTEYVPPVEVEMVEKQKAIPLDENEGIYVRDMKTGRVRAVIGETYMLTQTEELWEKHVSSTVEELLFPNQSLDGGMKSILPPPGSAFSCIQTATISRQQSAPRFHNRKTRFTPRVPDFEGSRGPIPQLPPPLIPSPPPPPPGSSFGASQAFTINQLSSFTVPQDEELWSKELPPAVETLLLSNKDPLADRSDRNAAAPTGRRDKTRVINFRVPHNAAVQIYDYKEKKARVAFGPDLVMLGPDEHFTQLSLSGGKPKRPNVIKSLCLLLGPDFCTDIVIVETSDHARLQLQLSYNWYFDSEDRGQIVAAKLFSVPDFVGDACKAVASRIRGMVAQVPFDDFHKNSARVIRSAVFGLDNEGKVKEKFVFPQNNLIVTSIDIQSVEPVDQRTRDSLQKSVTLAIEITTNAQEATAKHEAERLEQEARGKLERQKISDEAAAEKSRRALLELQSESAAVESTGQAKAEAHGRAEAAKIEGEAAVEQARLKAEASKIDTEWELSRLRSAREAELQYLREKNDLEINKTKELASIETQKFTNLVNSLGASTIQAIATAGPDQQIKLLQSLGLQTALITDGSSPINLFQTANGLIGGSIPGPALTGGLHKQKRAEPMDEED